MNFYFIYFSALVLFTPSFPQAIFCFPCLGQCFFLLLLKSFTYSFGVRFSEEVIPNLFAAPYIHCVFCVGGHNYIQGKNDSEHTRTGSGKMDDSGGPFYFGFVCLWKEANNKLEKEVVYFFLYMLNRFSIISVSLTHGRVEMGNIADHDQHVILLNDCHPVLFFFSFPCLIFP